LTLLFPAFIPAPFLRPVLSDLSALSRQRPSRAAPRRGLGKSVAAVGIWQAAVFSFQRASAEFYIPAHYYYRCFY